jgi:hypothetical protein
MFATLFRFKDGGFRPVPLLVPPHRVLPLPQPPWPLHRYRPHPLLVLRPYRTTICLSECMFS